MNSDDLREDTKGWVEGEGRVAFEKSHQSPSRLLSSWLYYYGYYYNADKLDASSFDRIICTLLYTRINSLFEGGTTYTYDASLIRNLKSDLVEKKRSYATFVLPLAVSRPQTEERTV